MLADAEREACWPSRRRRSPGRRPARTLALAAADPRGRCATLRHLRTGDRYTLAPGAFRAGAIPWPSSSSRRRPRTASTSGAAAVVLLRVQGVPARFVKGLASGRRPTSASGCTWCASRTHAWIEAWVPARAGSRRTDAAGALETARGRLGGLERLFQADLRRPFRGLEPAHVAGGRCLRRRLLRETGALALLAALGAAVVARPPAGPGGAAGLSPLALARIRLADRRTTEPPVSAELRARVRAVERRWAAQRPAPSGQPGACSSTRGRSRAGRTRLREAEADRRVVEAYYRARFGAMQDLKDPIPAQFLDSGPFPCVETGRAEGLR